jgi:hypothetical protein
MVLALGIAAASLAAPPPDAAAPGVEATVAGVHIRAASGTEYERQAVAQLARLLQHYDLKRWTHQTEILVQQGAGARNRGGVLRLSTRYTDDDDWALSVYVHEQGHLYFDGKGADREAAIADLDALYPDAPDNMKDGGARTRRDTLLHLAVCLLEYDAMVSLVGQERTRALFRRKDVYPWVYAHVLSGESRLRAVMAKNHLDDY